MGADARRVEVPDEPALARLAGRLAARTRAGVLITLSGPLAAGKTTFARAFLRALGYAGKVKSPTFTLVESYPLPCFTVHHFDLYRLADPGELYYMGFNEYLGPETVCLVEWPERAGDQLGDVDLALILEIAGPTARILHAQAHGPAGAALLAALDPADA
ncbi:MAG: tRNA (adenosine(37)-N6)-threonylcarbamoyltransferase complex ATPase subunit type 1 TsaE [Gammaproteobacteria bacterium]